MWPLSGSIALSKSMLVIVLSTSLQHTSAVVVSIDRAGGAGPVAQAMAGPILETFQYFSSGHMLVQAGNRRSCRLQAKCRMIPD